MTSAFPDNYIGPKPPAATAFLSRLAEASGLRGVVQAGKGKTVRLHVQGRHIGYFNSSVEKHGGLLGVRFSIDGKERDAFRSSSEILLRSRLQSELGATEGHDYVFHKPRDGGADAASRRYLVALSPSFAEKLLPKLPLAL
jgi:hypothetical protein